MTSLLRVVRADRPNDYVLINVEKNGPSVLDLKLVGTDGADPFVVYLKETTIHSLKSPKHHGSPDDWHSALTAVLLNYEPGSEVVQGLEAVASVVPAKTITISIRKNISGITVSRSISIRSFSSTNPAKSHSNGSVLSFLLWMKMNPLSFLTGPLRLHNLPKYCAVSSRTFKGR